MKKYLSLLLALCLCLSLCACTKRGEAAETPTEAPVEQTGAQVVNPMSEASVDSLLQDMGLDMSFLADYENVKFFKYSGTLPIAEAKFSYEGHAYSYRMATPGTETDISGMYYGDNVQTSEAKVDYNNATVRVATESGDISWYDFAPGVQYCLSTSEATSAEALTALANRLYVPTQGDAEGDAEVTVTADIGPALQNVLVELQANYHPGTAGGSLSAAKYAAQLADLFTETQPSAEDVRNEVRAYLTMLSMEDRVTFSSQLMGLQSGFQELASNGIAVLEDAGATAQHYPWDNATISTLFASMTLQGSEGAYALLLSDYADAIRFGMSAEELIEKGMNFMVKDMNLDTVGYAYMDLDNDGIKELILGTIADGDYLNALVLELDTLDQLGQVSQVFMSGERDRLYTMGGDMFNHQGSSSADDSFDTVEQYKDGALTQVGTEGGTHSALTLIPLSMFG